MRARLAGALFAVFLVSAANAQPLRGNEGPGIRLGDSMVGHAGVAAEVAYDSNVFYLDTDEGDGPVGAPYFRLVPHLAIATLSPQRGGETPSQRLIFRLGAALGFRKYFSSDDAIQAQDSIDVEANFRLTVNPQGLLAFSVYDNFLRTVQPTNAETDGSYRRDHNQVGGAFTLQPGGRALSFTAGYDYNINHFEDIFASGIDPSTTWHRPYGNIKWRFLPKTAAIIEGEARFYDKADDTGTLVDSTHYRILGGLQTLFTARVGAILKAGVAGASYDARADVTAFIALANLLWYISDQGRLTIGFARELSDSIFANWYIDNRPYVEYSHLIGARLMLGINAGYRHRTYGGIPENQPQFLVDTERTDNIVEGGLTADFAVIEWLYVGAAYYLTANSSDYTRRSDTGDDVQTDSYTKHVILGRVEVAY